MWVPGSLPSRPTVASTHDPRDNDRSGVRDVLRSTGVTRHPGQAGAEEVKAVS